LAPLDDTTLKALSTKKNIESMLDDVRLETGSTRMMNDLDALFKQYNGQNFEEILARAKEQSYLKRLDPKVFGHRRQIAEALKSSYSYLEQRFAVIYKPRHEGNREHELMLVGKDWEFLKHAHMGSAEYYLNLKWLFIDIEIPHFKRKDAKITWVGMKFESPVSVSG
jgi:hypothetical protein